MDLKTTFPLVEDSPFQIWWDIGLVNLQEDATGKQGMWRSQDCVEKESLSSEIEPLGCPHSGWVFPCLLTLLFLKKKSLHRHGYRQTYLTKSFLRLSC